MTKYTAAPGTSAESSVTDAYTMPVITVATHEEGYLAALKHSCKRFGYDLSVLGWKQPWRGFRWRMNLVLNALRHLRPEDVVMFVDAFDVVMTGPATEARDTFLSLQVPMFVSAQRRWHTCFGWFQQRSFQATGSANVGHGCRAECPSPYTMICAGTFIAFAGYAVGFLERCLREFPDSQDDQLMFNLIWNGTTGSYPFRIDCGRTMFNVMMPDMVSRRPRAIYPSDEVEFFTNGRVRVTSVEGVISHPIASHLSGNIQAATEIRRLGYEAPDDKLVDSYMVTKNAYHIKRMLTGDESYSHPLNVLLFCFALGACLVLCQITTVVFVLELMT